MFCREHNFLLKTPNSVYLLSTYSFFKANMDFEIKSPTVFKENMSRKPVRLHVTLQNYIFLKTFAVL